MSGKDRVFKKEYAFELLAIAENDLQAAKTLARDTLVRRETVLMMVQQAIEKGLKSALCTLGKAIPMTHDLYVLVDRFGTEDSPPHGADLDDLTPYATIRRYEEGRYEILEADLSIAFTVAADVLLWCRQKAELNG